MKQLDEATNKASLQAKLKRLKERQELDRQVAELQRRREMLELEEAIEMSKAREHVLSKYGKVSMSPRPPGISEPNPFPSSLKPEPFQAIHSKPESQPAVPPAESCPVIPHDVRNESTNPKQNQDLAPREEREQTAALMRLPLVEIKKFGGDVTVYAQFTRAFDLKIGNKISDEVEKLYYLEQHMVPGSKAHLIVSSCLYLTDGFQEAKRLLYKRYGQPATLASAYLDKISELKPIRTDDSNSLDHFAIVLSECKNALKDDSNLMEDPRTMRCITCKLPPPLVHRWRRQVDDIEEKNGRRATFEELVLFVTKEARVASNPVFGQMLYEGDQKRKSAAERNIMRPQVNFKQKTFVAATQAEPERSSCLFCDRQGHQVMECRRLGEATQEDKKAFVQRMSLCYGCLKRGHRSRECRRRATCAVCGRRHPTSLHMDLTQRQQGEFQQRPQ